MGHRIVFANTTSFYGHQAKESGERFGYRHHLVRLGGMHAVEVLLKYDLIALHHHQGIRIGLQEIGIHIDGLPTGIAALVRFGDG